MGLEEVNGLKGVQKERKSKPWAVYNVKKVRMDYSRPKEMKAKKVRS